MKRDLCEILQYYENDIDSAREMLYGTFKLIFNDTLKKRNLRLESQEIFTKEDLEWESFLSVDYLLSNISKNWWKKPIYKKKLIIWYNDQVMWCSQIKWYVYQTIARVVQDKATEKYWFRVPFNKNWTASQIIYQWRFEDMTVVSVNNKITYNCGDPVLWNMKKPFLEFWYDKELEKEYLMSAIYNTVNLFSYEEKKLFVQRYTQYMSVENIAKDWKISKESMLKKIHLLNFKIKKRVKHEKTNTWTFTQWIYLDEDISQWSWWAVPVENIWT